MLDVGRSSAPEDQADLAVFVDRLVGRSPDAGAPGQALDDATRKAADTVRARLAGGEIPPGLRRLAEALAAPDGRAAGGAEATRNLPAHSGGQEALMAALQEEALVVLEGFEPDQLAAAIAAMAAEGLRVAVTAADTARLSGLPRRPGAFPYVRALPAMTPSTLRELRRLLVTSTPARRSRLGQNVPPAVTLPPVEEVAKLCRRTTGGDIGSRQLLHDILRQLEPERRQAVGEVARTVARSLAALGPREEHSWEWPLLADLVHNRNRQAFDRLHTEATAAAQAAQRAAGLPPVTVIATLPPDAVHLLAHYLAFLESGGRPRSHFRSQVQRDVQPVLDAIRVADGEPRDPRTVQAAIGHLALADLLAGVDQGCRVLGLPAPRNTDGLRTLAEGLTRIGLAAHAVASLRHDVLFLHPTSPVAVPDLAAAEEVAAAIMDYEERGSLAEAASTLDQLAASLAGRGGPQATAPEHQAAIVALRRRDAEGYTAAVNALAGARREIADERRRVKLLTMLREQAPELADAWERGADAGGSRPTGFGLVWPVPLDELLANLPAADSLDAVVLLDADDLGVERLLVTAAAPRLVAVSDSGARPAGGATLLSVLDGASVRSVRRSPAAAESTGRVVHLPSARQSAEQASRAGA